MKFSQIAGLVILVIFTILLGASAAAFFESSHLAATNTAQTKVEPSGYWLLGLNLFANDLHRMQASTTAPLSSFSNLQNPFALPHRVFVAQVERIVAQNIIGVRYISTDCEDCYLQTDSLQAEVAPEFLTNGSTFQYYFFGIYSDTMGVRHYVSLIYPVKMFDTNLPTQLNDVDTNTYITESVREVGRRESIVEGATNTSFVPNLSELDAIVQAISIDQSIGGVEH